ncbi:integrator complex subunit 7 [Coccinella septempunctata]|uniref:integrator complex subunit 7 n=1 Tax=Coccinella septempunctata TaxID=41139 RepID=UPI001D0638F6|nr:integrator complex subunit 7 [Coccinella septempunctata]
MMGIRMNTFSENGLGEPEQDANSALTELDKGLRSGKVGEQCEAIVRFPKLFEKYPFPILINASLLKLADVFRMGNNFLRLCILRVCQQSEKHLDKISNVDEFIKRVYSVMHSNDPIGRAITLRTFGAVAAIIPERQQIHHSIRRSLDSHDNVEVEAAIYAAIQFAAQSKTFAVSMCNKVSDMIQGQTIPANMKLQLIPILQYMHHDTNTAAMVRNLCINLLPSYPSQDFVLVTLNTLTQLAAATLVDIPTQIELLIKYLRNDPRWEIKSKCLHYLYQLAKPGSHLWPPGAINEIIDIAETTSKMKILTLTLRVIQVLTESPRMCHDHRSPSSKVRMLCSKNSYSPQPSIAAQSIQILTQILCYCYKEDIEVDGADQVISALETLILLLTFSNEKKPMELKFALKCAVRLCESKQEYCETFVELLGTRLDNVNSDYTIIICETLGAIGGLKADTLLPLVNDILSLLHALADVKNPTSQQIHTKTMLCTLIFQTLSGYTWNEQTEETIKKVVANNNMWANYCIARAAVRYGHHKIAIGIFSELKEQVSSEHFHFWLVCLKEMSEAEAELYGEDPNSLVTRLDKSIIHYNKALAALKAASTPSHTLQFQAEYMKIRTEFLQCLVQLIYTCNILCIVPPPAIAVAIVQNTRDEFQRHGYITNQLRKCAVEFKNCGEMYWKLYQTAFDADPATLENMQILQQLCTLVEQCVYSICHSGVNIVKEEPINLGSHSARLESQQLIKACQNSVKISNAVMADAIVGTITHKQVDLLKKVVEVLANASLPIPRYFFQVLQSTSVKLAISPQPRVMGEFISVQAGSQLAVKVEGVIQHGNKPGLFRRIEEVVVTVTSQFQNNPKGKDAETKNLETSLVLTQTVSPHKDFFTAQFLLAFPRGGQYVLVVDASVIDEQCNTWKTGPRSTLTVKIPEEPKPTAISIPGMQSNANVILMPEDNLFIRPHQKKI